MNNCNDFLYIAPGCEVLQLTMEDTVCGVSGTGTVTADRSGDYGDYQDFDEIVEGGN